MSTAPSTLTVAVLGLGEAGTEIALGLAGAGARVRGFDPVVPGLPGVEAATGDADACHGADLVLSLTTASQADSALRQALPGMSATAVYADANTAAAGLKQRLAGRAGEAGVSFADVAIMAPVPGRGLHAPMVASGPGAEAASSMLGACGATVQVLDGPAGAAATRKLLRSVFYKGMAAAVLEALLAARSAGCEDWLREHIAAEFTAADGGTLTRLEEGSYRHAVRRAHEMAGARGLAGELSGGGRGPRAPAPAKGRPPRSRSAICRCRPGSPGPASSGLKTWLAEADPCAQRIRPASTPPYSSRPVTRGGSLGGMGLDVAPFDCIAGLGGTADFDRTAGFGLAVAFGLAAAFGFAVALGLPVTFGLAAAVDLATAVLEVAPGLAVVLGLAVTFGWAVIPGLAVVLGLAVAFGLPTAALADEVVLADEDLAVAVIRRAAAGAALAADAAGLATDIDFADTVSAFAAEDMALVAVLIACIAVDSVLADAVALVAADVSRVAAVVTFTAAVETVLAADAAVGAVLAVLRVTVPTVLLPLALTFGRLALLLALAFGPLALLLALAFGRLAALLDGLPRRARPGAAFAELRRVAVRVLFCTGIVLPPMSINY